MEHYIAWMKICLLDHRDAAPGDLGAGRLHAGGLPVGIQIVGRHRDGSLACCSSRTRSSRRRSSATGGRRSKPASAAAPCPSRRRCSRSPARAAPRRRGPRPLERACSRPRPLRTTRSLCTARGRRPRTSIRRRQDLAREHHRELGLAVGDTIDPSSTLCTSAELRSHRVADAERGASCRLAREPRRRRPRSRTSRRGTPSSLRRSVRGPAASRPRAHRRRRASARVRSIESGATLPPFASASITSTVSTATSNSAPIRSSGGRRPKCRTRSTAVAPRCARAAASSSSTTARMPFEHSTRSAFVCAFASKGKMIRPVSAPSASSRLMVVPAESGYVSRAHDSGANFSCKPRRESIGARSD